MHRRRRSDRGGGGAGLTFNFERHGAQLFGGAACAVLDRLRTEFANVPQSTAGLRLSTLAGLSDLINATGPIGSVAAVHLGPKAKPVRANYFDKSVASNWALTWHQDRTIRVRQRAEVSGFGPWTVKSGIHHVRPPAELLSKMVTVRVHLDPVHEQNAPLLIAPRSHLLGRIAENDINDVVARCGTYECHAAAGDIWLYSTLIVHASDRARQASRRRVLQIDYAAFELPDPLEWLDLAAP